MYMTKARLAITPMIKVRSFAKHVTLGRLWTYMQRPSVQIALKADIKAMRTEQNVIRVLLGLIQTILLS